MLGSFSRKLNDDLCFLYSLSDDIKFTALERYEKAEIGNIFTNVAVNYLCKYQIFGSDR